MGIERTGSGDMPRYVFSLDDDNGRIVYDKLHNWFRGDFTRVVLDGNKLDIYFNPKSTTIGDILNTFTTHNLGLTDESYTQLFRRILFPVLKKEQKDEKNSWSAFSPRPEVAEEDRDTFVNRLNNLDVKVYTETLSEGINNAINNLSLYGAKLTKDLKDLSANDADKNKQSEVAAKVEAVEEFLKTILAQSDLSSKDAMDNIRKVYLDLETKDKNRSHGFYKVQSFFRGLSYVDKNNETWYVRSTTGELMYHIMNNLEKEYETAHPHEDKQEDAGKRNRAP